MRLSSRPILPVLLLGLLHLCPAQSLLPTGGAGDPALAPSSSQVEARLVDGALAIAIAPGEERWPGLRIQPAAPWDLSAHGGVVARLTNSGQHATRIFLRVDGIGGGKEPWNAEALRLEPGASGELRIRFGQSWGKPGYALEAARVGSALLWVESPKHPVALRLESLVATGAKSADLTALRRVPDGRLLATVAEERITAEGASAAMVDGESGRELHVRFERSDGRVVIAGPEGHWDLRDHLEVRARVHNAGTSACRPRLRVRSQDDDLGWIEAPRALAPGAEIELVASFLTTAPIALDAAPRGFVSDHVDAIDLAAGAGSELRLLDLRATIPAPDQPEWLGQRPPEAGDWRLTFEDGFDHAWLDTRKWSPRGSNYWDERCHFSPSQVRLGDGTARLRFERKTGRHNDDKLGVETDFATGFLHSWDRFAQRYGYFECRLKTPTAPGLWPAFWLMPDRGPEAGIWWKRRSTHDGGMEFDIFEFLTRYGPYRTNLAMHWDGYEEEHAHHGSDRVYFRPDAEGFVTAGLLWEPGRASYYLQGREVGRWEDERVASVPMYLLFTNVSGGWGGNRLTGEGLPDELVIDYVRVWQRADLGALP